MNEFITKGFLNEIEKIAKKYAVSGAMSPVGNPVVKYNQPKFSTKPDCDFPIGAAFETRVPVRP